MFSPFKSKENPTTEPFNWGSFYNAVSSGNSYKAEEIIFTAIDNKDVTNLEHIAARLKDIFRLHCDGIDWYSAKLVVEKMKEISVDPEAIDEATAKLENISGLQYDEIEKKDYRTGKFKN